MSELIPLFPLPNVVLFPNVFLPLHIFEPRYREMVADAIASDRMIGMALLRPAWDRARGPHRSSRGGVLGRGPHRAAPNPGPTRGSRGGVPERDAEGGRRPGGPERDTALSLDDAGQAPVYS